MSIRTRIQNPSRENRGVMLHETMERDNRNYRADRLVEKWSNVKEIGKGITDLPTNKARNLAILLENQMNAMKKMTESQLSTAFYGYTPENMLRVVRLSYPNSIRGDLFTEFSMETMHDSIKYIYPVYTDEAQHGLCGGTLGRLDDGAKYIDHQTGAGLLGEAGDAMYEQTESRYATELTTIEATVADKTVTVEFEKVPGKYVVGDAQLLVDGEVVALQMTKGVYEEPTWFCKPGEDGADLISSIEEKDGILTVEFAEAPEGTVSAICRYNSEMDMEGMYLGEVELQMRDYHFRPRPITLGVTWTQLTELVLDTSFGTSAEEMLMDSAAQEIKKTLDYQAVKFANNVQKVRAYGNTAKFDAEIGGDTKDSYFHTAQTIQQSIDRIADLQLNTIGRGGVSAIVGGPAAVNYLKLNKGWSDKGKQPAIGGHKVGELDGIPVFKVPAGVVADDELLTTWKNDTNQGDVSIAIGTLMPFFSTGTIQRKNLYKEAAIARFEDTEALQPKYLGRVKIENLRTL